MAAVEKTEARVPAIAEPRLPYHPLVQERFGIDKSDWRALTDAIFPAAKTTDAVLLALSYCRARKLDPFKRPVHIVPIWDSGKRVYVETIWPGIGELRVTAFRTGQYAGADPTTFGEPLTRTFEGRVKSGSDWKDEKTTVSFPEWAQVTLYRMVEGHRVPVPGPRVYWTETYGRKQGTDLPNEMWQRRSRGQLEKCAEAAALRKAFPEEIGDDHAAEEMEGQIIEGEAVEAPTRPQRRDYAGDPIDVTERAAPPASDAPDEQDEPGLPLEQLDPQWEAYAEKQADEIDRCDDADGLATLREGFDLAFDAAAVPQSVRDELYRQIDAKAAAMKKGRR
jgi:phage recombination protein Bet